MAESRKTRTLFLTQFSILLALEALTCFTPLGQIPIGPVVATLGGIPIIAAAILLGTGAGIAMGAAAGLFSLIVWTFMPPNPLIAFVFTPFYSLGPFTGNAWSVLISFVPRMLVGAVAGWVFSFVSRAYLGKGRDVLAYAASGLLGSLMNTIFVLGGIYLIFGVRYAEALGLGYELLLGMVGMTALVNGVPEAVICAVAAYFVCRPIRKYVMR